MASLTDQSDAAHRSGVSRVQLEPVRDHHLLLDGSWWPRTGDLGVELRTLLPILEQARGPVARLLLSAAGWTRRPPGVPLAGRTVTVGYLAEQPPSMLTVLWADGGTFILRVARPGAESMSGSLPASGV